MRAVEIASYQVAELFYWARLSSICRMHFESVHHMRYRSLGSDNTPNEQSNRLPGFTEFSSSSPLVAGEGFALAGWATDEQIVLYATLVSQQE
jgi:hypothetical protein